jgi:hypothetical protein
MEDKQVELLNKIRSTNEKLGQLENDYFQAYSFYDTWQFWIILVMLLIPLIVLFISIDRKNIFLLGFFGLNYHLWFAYANVIGVRSGLWAYPYEPFPFLPGFSIDASLIPICYILLYQWTINHKKNIYLYALYLSAFLGFVFKPFIVAFDFFHMYDGINYIFLFVTYYLFFLISKIITNIFIWLQKRN